MQDAVFSIVHHRGAGNPRPEGPYTGIYRNGHRVYHGAPLPGGFLFAAIGYLTLRVEYLEFPPEHGLADGQAFPLTLAEFEGRLRVVHMDDDPRLGNIWASATHQELDDLATAHNVAGAVHGRNYHMVRFDLSEADPRGRWLLAKRLGA